MVDLKSVLKISFFDNISQEKLTHLCAKFEQKSFKSGDVVFRDGSDPDGVYFLLSGLLKVVHNEVQVALVHPGEQVGELAVLTGLKRAADIICGEDGQALFISKDDLVKILESDKDFCIQVYKNTLITLTRGLKNQNFVMEASKLLDDIQVDVGDGQLNEMPDD